MIAISSALRQRIWLFCFSHDREIKPEVLSPIWNDVNGE
jgi:hypothetical protein